MATSKAEEVDADTKSFTDAYGADWNCAVVWPDLDPDFDVWQDAKLRITTYKFSGRIAFAARRRVRVGLARTEAFHPFRGLPSTRENCAAAITALHAATHEEDD